MKTRLFSSLLTVFAFSSFAPFAAHAENEIGFVEKFALAQDREAVLAQLLPGSEEFYFYHALHFQNTRNAAKLKATMEQWATRFPKSPQRTIIENREALLTYDADPQATLKFLKDRLKLQFNHQQEARNQKPNLPTALEQKLIAREVFAREALRAGDDLSQANDAALEAFVREKVALKPAQVRALLARLKRPDVPNLVELIAANLKTRESGGFGEFGIHRALLPEQLDDLAKRVPTVFENQAFVFARLRKLSPGADEDAEFDPVAREAWLERAWSYAKNLPPTYNSLKAHILFRRLEHDRQLGIYDAARFLEYLKLPRRTNYVAQKFIDAPESSRFAVDMNAAFGEALPPAMSNPFIGNDEPLVRDYFLHLLPKLRVPPGDLDTVELLKTWTPFVREAWLRPLLAEAMITSGIGDAERWASLLSPVAFQALKNRVDIDFAAANVQFSKPADDVSVELFVKNAPKVIVKIYEINTLSFFLTQKRQLNTDLQLDGLVANREQTHDFTADVAGRNPLLRTARRFSFPELKGRRGAWVIEFIGGGKSSRALVRKGQWSLLQRTGPAGDIITVLDENHTPVKDAAVWLDGRCYTGSARVPRVVSGVPPETTNQNQPSESPKLPEQKSAAAPVPDSDTTPRAESSAGTPKTTRETLRYPPNAKPRSPCRSPRSRA